jgi:SpoVK/Ycf46/Vps4 family AAA+-type ATPase
MDPDFKPEEFIKICPLNLSGADFYSIANRARQQALKRLINSQEESGGLARLEENQIYLNDEDFGNSLIGFQPTLSESALLEYEKYFHSYSNKQ